MIPCPCVDGESARIIEELRAELADRDRQLRDRDLQLADRDLQLADREARIRNLENLVKSLQQDVERLKVLLSQNSKNSNRPPSSDPAGSHKGKNVKPTGRKRGGQKGHPGSRRALLPIEQVDEIVNLYPENCEDCSASLPQVEDPDPSRHQVTEIPLIKPHTKETRRHEVACPCCGHRTRAAFDEATMGSPFGPRLSGIIGMTTGAYHLSRRKAAAYLSDLVGLRISLGGVSNAERHVSEAIAPAVEEIREKAESAPVKHADGSSWRQSGTARQVWTIATPLFVFFKILSDGTAGTLARELLRKMEGILVSDRAAALMFWSIERRQICWAHLIRKFASFAQRSGRAGKFGRELLEYSGLVFDHWHAFKDGRISRAEFQELMVPVRKLMEELLVKAEAAGLKELSGSCTDILLHKKALWTFVDEEGVDPTNNRAEREIRDFVLWRKICQGTKSERGNLFAERIMTIAHTARRQHRDLLTFLTASVEAYRLKLRPPSLVGLPGG